MPPRSNTYLQPGCVLCIAVAVAGCAMQPPTPAPAPAPPAETTRPAAPPTVTVTVTRGQFTIEAGMLDTWNAIGQIVVRTDDVTYESRAQMLGLYSVRYRGEPFLILTRALLLSDTIRDTTTLVTATTSAGKPIDSNASADLLALLQRELPGEIERVIAKQAAERKAKAARK